MAGFFKNQFIMKCILPLVVDNFVEGFQQFGCGHISNGQRLSNTTCNHALYIVSLVTKQWEHHHGHSIAYTLIDAMGSSMCNESLSLRVT